MMQAISRKTFLLSVVGTVLCGWMAAVSLVHAQGTDTSPPEGPLTAEQFDALINERPELFEQIEDAELVATVNFLNAEILSKEANTFDIRFEISNRELVQPDIKYSVRLVEEDEDGTRRVLEERVYDEVFSLNAEDSVVKTIRYEAPEFLTGTYAIEIVSANKSGLGLGSITAGTVSLTGSGAYVTRGTCDLRIKDEGTVYGADQGVDIAAEEELEIICSMTNQTGEVVEATPHFVVYARTIFGEQIRTVTGEVRTLPVGGPQEVVFDLPKETTPQAYDVTMVLTANGEPISEQEIFHYVIQGGSGTVMSARLDRDQYNEGDHALVSMVVTGAADSFPGSRAQYDTRLSGNVLDVYIEDGSGNRCSKDVSEVIEVSTEQGAYIDTITVPIDSACVDPRVVATLSTPDGSQLDAKSFAAETKESPLPASGEEASQIGSSSSYIVAGLMTVMLLFVLLFFLRKHDRERKRAHVQENAIGAENDKEENKNVPLQSLLVICAFGMALLGGAERVQADTYYADNRHVEVGISYSGTRVTGHYIKLTACNNVQYNNVSVRCDYNGDTKKLMSLSCISNFRLKQCREDFETTIRFSKASCGTHRLSCTGYVNAQSANGNSRYFTFSAGGRTINAGSCAVSGQCGPADGTLYSEEPPQGALCNAGRATAVARSDDEWTWACFGASGGTNQSCRAPAPLQEDDPSDPPDTDDPNGPPNGDDPNGPPDADGPWITAEPPLISSGEVTTISWDPGTYTDCTIENTHGDTGLSGRTADAPGSETTAPLFSDVTYSLSCAEGDIATGVQVRESTEHF